jgi:cytochrome c
MTDFGAKVKTWDFDHLYLFLASPQSYLAGTKMSFVGLKQPQDRINLIAWLRTQSSSPLPIPPPNPKAAAAPAAAPGAAAAPADAKAPAADAPAPPAAAAPAKTT